MEKKEEITLTERKEMMLHMLKIFMEYCSENNLKVFLAGGTLLGAVRHKGYIPWDDDIDVMMPIDDWDKLMNLIKDKPLPAPFEISSPSTNKAHMWPFIKMINNKTMLVEPMVTKKLRKEQESFYGIYIDIFPMYGLPKNTAECEKFQQKLVCLYDKFKKSTRVMNRRSKDSFLQYKFRCFLYFIYCFPERIRGRNYYLDCIYNMIRKVPLTEAKFFGWTMGLTEGKKDHISVNEIDRTIILEFEGLKCPVFSNYDVILKNQYGDYKILPPEEQRHVHPSNIRWRE